MKDMTECVCIGIVQLWQRALTVVFVIVTKS